MVFCKTVDALYAVVPFRFFRNLLIRSHIERCGHCQARLVSRTEAEALFVKSGDMRAEKELWRLIARRVGRDTAVPGKKPAWPRWEWAAGATTFLVLAAASLWLLRGVQTVAVRADYARPAGRFEINYINVGGAPAQAYIYQPQGSDMIIVWAEKTS